MNRESSQHQPPTEEYFSYLRDAATIECEGETWRLALPFHSLQSLVSDGDLATTTIHIERGNGAWRLSDHGQNARALLGSGQQSDSSYAKETLQRILTGSAVEVSSDGSLTLSTSSQMGMGSAIHEMVKANISLTRELFHKIRDTSTTGRDVFDLDGEGHIFGGSGRGGDSTEETPPFDLREGALIVASRHSGDGDFNVKLAEVDGGMFNRPAELVSLKGEAERTIIRSIEDTRLNLDPREIGVSLIGDVWLKLKPGSYYLDVEATGDWECRLLQPNLGQSSANLPYACNGDEGILISGPFRVGSRPLMVSGRYDAGGAFFARLVSVDGTDDSDLVRESGQFHLEERPTAAMPGKEYLLWVEAGGYWELEFTEGY